MESHATRLIRLPSYVLPISPSFRHVLPFFIIYRPDLFSVLALFSFFVARCTCPPRSSLLIRFLVVRLLWGPKLRATLNCVFRVTWRSSVESDSAPVLPSSRLCLVVSAPETAKHSETAFNDHHHYFTHHLRRPVTNYHHHARRSLRRNRHILLVGRPTQHFNTDRMN